MKKLSDNQFDNLFKDRFQNFEVNPPDYLKNKISQSVNSKPSGSGFSGMISSNKWLLSGLALIVITGIIAFTNIDFSENTNYTAEQTVLNANTHSTPVSTEIISDEQQNLSAVTTSDQKINHISSSTDINNTSTNENIELDNLNGVITSEKSSVVLNPKAGKDVSVCGLSHKLNASLSTEKSSGSWTGSGPGKIIFSDISNPKSDIEVTEFGYYQLEWTETLNDQKAKDVVAVNFTKSGNLVLETNITNCTCHNSDGEIVVTAAGSNENFQYFWQDEIKPSGPSRDDLPAGEYTIRVIDDTGCETTTTVTIGNTGIPAALFSHRELSLAPKVPVYFINQTKVDNIIYSKVNNIQFSWDFGDGQTSVASEPDHEYDYDGEFRVKLYTTSEYGCVDSSFTLITISSGNTKFPEIITPNGDGMNDVFKVNLQTLNNFDATIMNRSGNILYEWKDQNQGWDGKLADGSYAATGTYFYLISGEDKTGKVFQYKGFFQLNR